MSWKLRFFMLIDGTRDGRGVVGLLGQRTNKLTYAHWAD